ncbi:ABC transporter ATP-binding protein [Microvirga antarctica]|uniref:ABC transporter ATP-binding protein n=1 Tax=Microvirga antarctica TaxID=2819233 RepID=UPI001B30BB81|nr:ABC transporter ATP-binding protein [Microvirga antarctica]
MTRDDLLALDGVSRTFGGQPTFLSGLLGQSNQGTRAVDSVSLTIRRGETLGLVGESGCGKSTLARIVAGLIKPDRGTITFKGRPSASAASARPRVQMIFQDPFSSLNGRWTVGRIVAEPIRVHNLRKGSAVRDRVAELLEQVGLSAADVVKYPHEFSGGQRQRIAIARSLAGEPDFLILDEPTSALDVSVQAQILNLLKDLQRDLDLTYFFITHNLGVVRVIADRIGVMYLGQIVEIADNPTLFEAPRHPYTRLLLDAALDLDTSDLSLHPIPGELPSPQFPPPGCRFQSRCPRMKQICIDVEPVLTYEGESAVRCHFPLLSDRQASFPA